MDNNIVVNQIPIDLFELFLNNGGDVELEDVENTYLIHINAKQANEYYKKYFLDIVQEQKIKTDTIKQIPIYINNDTKSLLNIKEIDELVKKNVLGKLMSYIVKFDFGNGMQDYLVLEFSRKIFNEMIRIDTNLNTNIPAGILSISVDLMYILVNKEEFKNNNFFNFVTDINNGDVMGLMQEPDYKEGGDVKILQLY